MDELTINNIVNGIKKIESRFSKNKITPFNNINKNDIVYLKKSGGNILASFEVKDVMFFDNLNSKKINEIKNKYNNLITAPNKFWESKKDSKYATLIYINNPKFIKSFSIIKKNRQAFISFNNIKDTFLLYNKQIKKKLYDCGNNHHLVNEDLKCEKCNNCIINKEELSKLNTKFDLVIKELEKSKWNYDWINYYCNNKILDKEISKDEIKRRLIESIYICKENDGRQTPFSGNIIYLAQHATGTCCRKV